MNLTEKYNVPGPRYTSYPTVPFWDEATFTPGRWQQHLNAALASPESEDGISLYIHLPFCQSLCTFCACNKHITVNHAVEKTYMDYLLTEWRQILSRQDSKPLIREIHLGGGTPTFFSPAHLRELLETLLAQSRVADGTSFSFEGHPNNTRREHLEVLANLGFDRVSFGVQDYDPKVQLAINRIQPYENVHRVTTQARELGYASVTHDLIFGLPFQSLDSIDDTIAKTLSLKPERIALYSYAHVPWLKGTGQRAYSEADLPDGDTKRRLYESCKQQLVGAGYVEIGMDHFALPQDNLFKAMHEQRLHRNFMGYTETRTSMMIGLGMSAISDCGTAFAQNAKTVREYYARLDAGQSPLIRGHVLDDEDLLMRSHILNLMCGFQTRWQPGDQDYRSQIRQDLHEMSQDGLVEITDEAVTVTRAGQAFVRNICMAFDLRLQHHQPERQIFSMTV